MNKMNPSNEGVGMKCMVSRSAPFVLIMIFLLSLVPSAEAASPLGDVTVDNPVIDLQQHASSTISWRLTEKASVTLFICDLRGNIIKTLLAGKAFDKGSHSAIWDGVDDKDLPCANGVYLPIIKCSSPRKGNFVYNPTASTWGEQVEPIAIRYDSEQEVVTFTLEQMTYARLRVGLREGGPVYKTLAGWQLWKPGQYQVPWDGKGKGGFQNVLGKDNLTYSFDSFSLAENSLIIENSPENDVSTDRVYEQFPIHPPATSNLSYFAIEPGSLDAEPEIVIDWQKAKNKDNQIVISGKVQLQVDFVKPVFLPPSFGKWGELLLYIDDEFVIEVPVQGLPATIAFDSNNFANGEHLLTINLLTGDDRAGIVTHKVLVHN
ncbi:hypothetical protein KJ612_19345 [Myxococcota bacterium]|nr:hypothetical protein [Myxococcota bacterium]